MMCLKLRALAPVAALMLLVASAPGCKLGPYPDLLEPVDKLQGIEGEATGWVLPGEDETQVLVLGGDRFLWSVVGRDTSVTAEVGQVLIEGGRITFTTEVRYLFPTETGPVEERLGAQVEEDLEEETLYRADLTEDTFDIEGVGTFHSMEKMFESFDVETEAGRTCLARSLQLSIRTVQARILNFGGSGTLIYRDNLTPFVGALSGRHTVLMKGLTSPTMIMTYEDFSDFPDLVFQDTFYTEVDSSGTGNMRGFARFGVGADAVRAKADPSDLDLDLLFSGRLIYGPDNAVEITGGDVTGGAYGFELEAPAAQSHSFPWQVLQDLDLRGCTP